jgi:hypothetical protein
VAVRSTVNGGTVKVARVALEYQATHRNTTTSHFWSQVLGYRAEGRDAAQELTTAFCIGVGLWKDSL